MQVFGFDLLPINGGCVALNQLPVVQRSRSNGEWARAEKIPEYLEVGRA